MIAALLAAALTALTPAAARPRQPPLPDARPALWVVNDHDTIIYLFGTFHALDGRAAWFNDEVMTAFAASDEVVLETLVPEPASAGAPAATGRQAPQPAIRRIGPIGPVAGSASFLSDSKMVMSAGRARGMSTEKGADSILRRAAESAGKPVAGLEGFAYQLGMFGRLKGAPQPSSQADAVQVSGALSLVLGSLQQAWNRGDVESFTPLLERMRTGSPENYRLLFSDRNARWAGWISQRLQQPGTVFVAVGAGHLAGRDSVQHKLAQAGVRAARLN